MEQPPTQNRPTQGFQLHSLQTAQMDLYSTSILSIFFMAALTGCENNAVQHNNTVHKAGQHMQDTEHAMCFECEAKVQ